MGDTQKEFIVWQDRKHFLWFPWSFTRYSISIENGRLVLRSELFNSSVRRYCCIEL